MVDYGADRHNGICNKTRQRHVRRLLMRVKVRKAHLKYEIITKPMVLGRVEDNLLKSAHYY